MSDGQDARGPARLGPGRWCAVVGFAAILYGVNLGSRALTDHETYVAGIARQLAVEGDWLLPRIGDQPWVEKPPLIHWLVAALGRVFGFSEGVVRAPSALAGLGVVVIVGALAARWFGARVGLLAGLVQASTLYMIQYARLAEVDMTLALSVVGALAVFARLQRIGEAASPPADAAARRWPLVFWTLVGLTNWLKGPLFGAVMILGPCMAWLLWRRDSRAWARLTTPVGITIAVALAVAWPLLVVTRMPAALEVLGLESMGRAAGELPMFTQPVWYYLATWPVQLLPWTLALLVGAGLSLRRAWREPDSPDRFLWCWALVPLLLLSVPRSKGHHYLIYALPAAAPIMALGLVRFDEWSTRRPSPWPRPGTGLVVAALVAAVTAGVAWRLRAVGHAAVSPADVVLVGSVSAGALIVIDRALARRRPGLALGAVIVTIAAISVYWNVCLGPRADRAAADRDFLRAVATHVPPSARLFALGQMDIARYAFYVDRPIAGCWTPEAIAGRIAPGESFYVVARQWRAPELSRLGNLDPVMRSARTAPRPAWAPPGTEDLTARLTLYRVEGRARGPRP